MLSVTEFFKNAVVNLFRPQKLGRTVSKLNMMLKNRTSIFTPEPLKNAVQDFFGRSTSLFAPALAGDGRLKTRIAVVSATKGGEGKAVISNYNRPRGQNITREEDHSNDMRVWEAAMATSATPYYLPPFEKIETSTTYLDGSIFGCCPAQIAYEEAVALWPANSPALDLLVSLGTGLQIDYQPHTPSISSFTGFTGSLSVISSMMQRQMDVEKCWIRFQSGMPPAIKSKLHRLDPPLDDDQRQAFDDASKIEELVSTTKAWIAKEPGRNQIRDIAHKMLANLFFFEPDDNSVARAAERVGSIGSGENHLSGSIRCRLHRNSGGLRRLLTEKVDSLWYTVVAEGSLVDEWMVANHIWKPLRVTDESPELSRCVDLDAGEWTVKVGVNLKDRFGSNRLHVIALRVRDTEKYIPISGFPATLAELVERASAPWLQ